MADGDGDGENWIERNSKTISTLATVAIPVVLALIGVFANRALKQDELDQSYVVLAIETLKQELPENERTTCISTIRDIGPDRFESAEKLAAEFQARVSSSSATAAPVPTSDDETAPKTPSGRVLPQTLFRSYALDLLLTSTPATLSVGQYAALLCAETIVPPFTQDGDGMEADADQQVDPDVRRQQRLENAAVTVEDCRVVVAEGTTVVAVGQKTLGAGTFAVRRVASITDGAPTADPSTTVEGSATSTAESTTTTVAVDSVRYIEVVVEALDATGGSSGTTTPGTIERSSEVSLLWVPVGPGMKEQKSDGPEPCTP